MTPITDEAKHSAAHILAQAVQRVYPKVKIGIGPVTKDGFYYDFDLGDKKITPETIDLPEIEQEIKKIILENLPFKQVVMPKETALNYMLQMGQIYKSELINVVPDDSISFFKTGDEFIDVCRGPHIAYTGDIGPIILTKVISTFWNEDPKRPPMIRIYGKTFYNEDEVSDYRSKEEQKSKKSYLNTLKNFGMASKEGNINILGLKYIEKVSDDLSKKLGIYSNLRTDIFGIHENTQSVLADLESKAFTIQRAKEKSHLKTAGKTLIKNLPLKDSLEDQITYFHVTYCKEQDLFLNIGFIENFLDQVNFENNNVTAEIEFNDAENSVFRAISGILQNKYISHDRVITESKEILVRINVLDELDREWKLAEVRIRFNGDKSIMLFTLPLLNYIAFQVESNPSFPKSYYDVYLIPTDKKFESYSFELADELSQKGFVTKVLKNTSSLKKRIRKSYIDSVKYTLLLGAKEVSNSSISLRSIEEDIGLVKNEELISYLEKLDEQIGN